MHRLAPMLLGGLIALGVAHAFAGLDAPQPMPTFSVGAVTTGAPGSAAAASLRQIGPNTLVIDLTIPQGPTGAAGAAGQAGAQGSTGAAGATGAAGTPKRVEDYTLTATGTASFTWPACASAPALQVLDTWIAATPTLVTGAVTASTVSSATVAVYETQAVPLGGQPFKASTTARSVTLRVICN